MLCPNCTAPILDLSEDTADCEYCGAWIDTETGEAIPDLEYMYGYPPAGLAPEDFTPDYELCTRDEIRRWQLDLLHHRPHKSDTGWVGGEIVQVHVLAPSWGIGMYKVRD